MLTDFLSSAADAAQGVWEQGTVDGDQDGAWIDDIMAGSMKWGGAALNETADLMSAAPPVAKLVQGLGSFIGSDAAVSAAESVGDFYSDFRGSRGEAAADTTDATYADGGGGDTFGAQARDFVGADVADGIMTGAGALSGAGVGTAIAMGSGAPLGMLGGLGAGTALGGLGGTLGGAAIGGLGSAATGGLTGAATGAALGSVLGPLGMLAGGAMGGLGGAMSSGLLGALGGGLGGGLLGSAGGAVLGSAGGGVAGVLAPILGGAAIGGTIANPSTNPLEHWAE